MKKRNNIVKNVVAYLLVFTVLLGNSIGLNCFTITAHAIGDSPDANGANGTQSKPYIINEASDFTWITTNNKNSSHLLQTANIDLTGFTWTPIGPNNAAPFSGTYDGNGYTISNMSLNDGTLSYMGMFGYTSNATIKNVTLSAVSLTGGQTENQAAIGAIAGMSTGTTTIERCRVVGVSAITGATNDTIGGVVGSNGGSIKYCSSTATISSGNYDTGSKPYSGGIAGSNWGTIDNCFNRGNVSVGTGASAGGIVGFGYSNTLSKCYSTGTVTGAGSEVGAIVGNVADASNISSNYYLSGVAASGIGKLDSVGGASEVGTTATTDANLKLQVTYSGWDFAGNTWTLQAGVNNNYPMFKSVATVDPTSSATSITITGATVGGIVLSSGYGTISEQGIEYTKYSESSFTKIIADGSFSADIVGLIPDTQYYARAYVINEVGTSYGEPIVFSTNPLAPQMVLNVLPGSAVGTTKVTITDVATDHFVVNITDAPVGYVEADDTAPSSGVNFINNYISGSDISTGVTIGKYLQIYDVNNLGQVVKLNEVQLNVGHIKMPDLSLPIVEDFESAGSLPDDWIQAVVVDAGNEVIWSCANTSTEDTVTANPNTGNYMAKVDFYSADVGSTSRLSLARNFSLAVGGSYELSFYMFHSTPIDFGPNDAIQPQISTDGGFTWENLGVEAIKRVNGDSGWLKHTFSLNSYGGEPTVKIGFLGVSDYGYSVFIDDVEVISLLLDAKSLTADTSSNDVDNDLEITFAPDAAFEGAITGVSYNGNVLDASQYVVSSGKVTLKPSVAVNSYLRTPGTGNVVIVATGYGNSTVSQTINAGAVETLEVTTQPGVGAASGDTFGTQPVVKLKDQYGNYCTTGVSATANVVATAKSGTGSWSIGGTTTKAAVAGTATFTDLTCSLTTVGNGAISFTSGIKTVDSDTFTIPLIGSTSLTADMTNNSVDNDLEITFASDASFEGAITGVSYNGNALDASQYVVSSGKVTLKPSVAGNSYLRTPGTGNVVIMATGYGNSTVSQTINAGAVETLEITTQPVVGAASGDAFGTQPVVKLKDQYGNYCTTGVSATVNVVATAKSGTGSWSIGGTTTKAAVAGTATFTDLTCSLTTVGNGAISFTSGIKTVDSDTFTIPLIGSTSLTADMTNNSVDNDLEITFAPDAAFEGAITGVSYNGNVLEDSQYVVSSGKVTLKPSVAVNSYLRTPGTGNVVIVATGYGNSTVSQTINAGAVETLEITTQPVVGAASGDAFGTQPVVKLKDQYGNYCTTGVSATANVVATAKSGTGSWSIGGTTTKAAVAGTATFTDLTCSLTTVGNGAISFTSGIKTVDSDTFTIPLSASKNLTADTTSNSVDNDLEITFAPDASFEGAITGVSYNGNALDASQYEVSSGKVTLKPSVAGNSYLRTPGTGTVVIVATGYGNSTVSQTINAGAVETLEITTQPVVGAASGDAFGTQPVVKLKDQYGNYCTTGVSATANVVATAKSGTGSWSIGGTTTKAAVAGTATFTDLTCSLTTVGNGAISFTSEIKTVDSDTFTIPLSASKNLTADTTSNSVDNDLEITFAPDAAFEGAITGVSYNGNVLEDSQYVVSSGKVTLKPSVAVNNYLRTPGTGNVVIVATGYGNSTVSQTINAGAVETLEITTQPLVGAETGNAFASQPVITLKDQFGNICANGMSASADVTVLATAGTGTWAIGGTVTKAASNGVVAFTDLTCTLLTSGNGKMTFTCGTKTADSNLITIPERNSTITPTTEVFDLYTAATDYKDISTDLTLNSNALNSIKNGSNTLIADTDYTIVGTTCTIKKEYLKTLSAGTTTLTFDFSIGVDPVLIVTVSNSMPASSGSGSSSTSTQGSSVVEVNGQKQDAGTVSTQTSAGQTITTIKVDDTKLDKLLASSGEKPTVTLPTNKASDVVVGELNGQTVKNMEQKAAVLEIRTESVSYTLPAAQINIDDVSSQIGEQVELKDIKVSVKIAEPPADTVKIVENTAEKNNYQIVVKPVEFEITCTSGEKTVAVSKFNGYVERTVAIPDGIDPSKITTGIVLNSDGTFSHVPTQIVVIDGKYYAKINSLTNSTYSVIYNPVEFTDIAKHWAKNAINDMGSRMVVAGTGNNTYEPNRGITRAEFSAIVIRGMGLREGTAESSFEDVTQTDWFNGYVDTATAYGLINGYSDTEFGPNDTITREQAIAIIARAMKTTGLNVSLTDGEVSAILAKYTDGACVSDYAKAAVAACVKSGIVTGTGEVTLSPKAYVTRAEVAVMIRQLLQKSGLI